MKVVAMDFACGDLSEGYLSQCQVPLYVATKMVSKVAFIEKDSVFIPTAEAYGRAAMDEIGYKYKYKDKKQMGDTGKRSNSQFFFKTLIIPPHLK
ncbi:hypothetical protein LR48_Vigan747s000800 [Vigna angularis]|uniref:Uncharacterized protein n=1 Tax=Phaseolus angularis TaxID=3914 RepID=A0A0L9TGT7_PHAAN|nr:hypothetical protein LR48_Vigan747s000800 [Vigna angularis]